MSILDTLLMIHLHASLGLLALRLRLGLRILESASRLVTTYAGASREHDSLRLTTTDYASPRRITAHHDLRQSSSTMRSPKTHRPTGSTTFRYGYARGARRLRVRWTASMCEMPNEAARPALYSASGDGVPEVGASLDVRRARPG